MRKIGFISPYLKGCRVAERIAHELGVEIICDVGVMDAAVKRARTMFEVEGVQAIIDRQPTAAILSQIWGDSIVELGLSNYALTKTILKAKKHSSRMAYIIAEGCEQQKEQVQELEELLGVSITCIEFSGKKTQEKTVELLKEMGFTVAISAAACMLAPCRAKGIPLYLIELDEESLRLAIKSAIAIANVKEISAKMRSYLDAENEGILLCDESGIVQLCNHMFCQISGLDENLMIGKTIQEIGKYALFFKLISNRKNLFQFKKTYYSLMTFHYEDANVSGQVYKVVPLLDYEYQIGTKLSQPVENFNTQYTFDSILGESRVMKELKEEARSYAQADSPVLIIGESGTGKELFAQSIHNAGKWADGPFVAVNCAALPENLLESELYGYADGAFTGARRGGKAGMFELSDGGTLFLDEISELPLILQAKLLRSIQEKQIVRVGGTKTIQIHNRIICACNRNLIREVQEGRFRNDLFYRICVLSLQIPPLRERENDVQLLAKQLCRKFSAPDGTPIQLSDELCGRLVGYNWPGNIRQLMGFLESMAVTARSNTITEEHFEKCFERFLTMHGQLMEKKEDSAKDKDVVVLGDRTLEELEQEIICRKYEEFHHNVQATANVLGISRTTLWRKLNPSDETKK